MDFAKKIGKFFETKDHTSLQGPYILFETPDESSSDGNGEQPFDVSLN